MTTAHLQNATICLNRHEDKIWMSYQYSVPLDAVRNFMPGQLYRVLDYNNEHKILYLKADGAAPQSSFNLTSARYGPLLEQLGVERIEIELTGMAAFAAAYNQTQPIKQSPQELPKWIETFNCDIKLASFEEGYITFDAYVRAAQQYVTITINNPSIRKHFDAVKNYIWKLLGKRKIPCEVELVMKENKLHQKELIECSLSTLSGDIIEQIDEHLVEEMFFNNETEDIVNFEDIVSGGNDDHITVEWAIEHLLTEGRTKHYSHLRYLSARQEILYQKLSVTGKPLSFLFFIKYGDSFFLVWEPYKTDEATYLWRLKSNDHQGIRKEVVQLYALVQWLRKNNKQEYRKQKVENFYFIEHEYLLPLNGFTQWKQYLEMILNGSE